MYLGVGYLKCRVPEKRKMDFPSYKFLCQAATFIGVETTFCGDEFPFVVQNRTMAGQFSAHVMTSVIAGFIISFPYVLYEFWKFISPGLLAKEKSKCLWFEKTKYSDGILPIDTYKKELDEVVRQYQGEEMIDAEEFEDIAREYRRLHKTTMDSIKRILGSLARA